MSTGEQEEVVVVVVVVVVRGGGGCGLSLYPLTRAASFVRYYQCRVSPSLCLFFFLFACFFWGGEGVGAGCGCRGWWGERRQLNLPGVFTIHRRLHTSVNMRT